MAYPGTMPFLNRQAVVLAVRMASALKGQICSESAFDRKCYYYPDLPKAYQITQDRHPLMNGGYLDLNTTRIRIREAHIEEDSARIVHDPSTEELNLDFNRAGIALLEIVTEADIEDAIQACEFLKKLHKIAKDLGVCNGKMEEGAFRFDANISLFKEQGAFGECVEVKNLNSFRLLEKVINYEKIRQMEIIEQGGMVAKETRTYDVKLKKTVPLRKKVSSKDYRFLPEPDLGTLRISNDEIEAYSRNEALQDSFVDQSSK
jgi:aspartyl-tRNA(Asn)/glutamyl-tRNA(Gln) amidotransferase subunit B